MQIVAKRGAARVILLGYDMKATNGVSHWHGNHGFRMANHEVWKNQMIPNITSLAPFLAAAGVEVALPDHRVGLAIEGNRLGTGGADIETKDDRMVWVGGDRGQLGHAPHPI